MFGCVSYAWHQCIKLATTKLLPSSFVTVFQDCAAASLSLCVSEISLQSPFPHNQGPIQAASSINELHLFSKKK